MDLLSRLNEVLSQYPKYPGDHVLKRKWPELAAELEQVFDLAVLLICKYELLKKGITQLPLPLCEICGEHTIVWHKWSWSWLTTCGAACARILACRKTLGTDYPGQSKVVQAKREEALKKTLGPEWAQKIAAKGQKTNLAKYGVLSPSALPEVRTRIEATNFER